MKPGQSRNYPMTYTITIRPEIINLTDAAYITAARTFSMPDLNRLPGYEVRLHDGQTVELIGVYPDLDQARKRAERLRGGDTSIPIIF
jgi:hypothetical protein